MSQEQVKQLLQQGIAAARGGRPDIARQFLQQVVRLEPGNETAWLWLSSVAADNKERIFCLRKLLEINPGNEQALKGLRALGVDPVPTTERVVTGGVPVLDEARYNRVIQAADEFLRRHNPQPPDRLAIQWARRGRGRYGEGGARRLRQAAYMVVALFVVAFVAGLVFLVLQLDISTEGGLRIGAVPTRIPSLTPRPTFTPTVGGPTPTPFPAEMAVPATRVPEGIKPGNPFGLATPTAIYPEPNRNVARILAGAVNYYSIGAYDVALEQLSSEREKSLPDCYVSIVYYEALTQASLGNYADALELLNWAGSYDAGNLRTSCQGDPLLLVGLAQVAFMQDPLSPQAQALAEQALAADARLVPASVVKAQVQLGQGDASGARTTISLALGDSPQDHNLLLVAAQVELANDQPVAALTYLSQVLYADPASLPALYLQAETYLQLASQASGVQQVQYYGLAVRSAQTLLLYYAGDPAGYLYLAQARIGEGNDTLAETALTRIIEVADALPAHADSIIQEAYRLRGELRYRQGRAAEALLDLKAYLARSDEPDPQVMLQAVDSALRSGDYLDALNQVSTLADLMPDDHRFKLLEIRLLVEICEVNPASGITCQHRAALQTLSDDFITGLATDAERAEAYSYRAQAQYWNIAERSGPLSSADRRTALQLARNDIDSALAVRATALDYYIRGLILEALDQPVQALEALQWVQYWDQVYPYPFTNDEFDNRVEALASEVQEILSDQAATQQALTITPEEEETEAVETPEETEEPVRTPGPATRTTPSPEATPRPTRTVAPTAVPEEPEEEPTSLPIP